MTDKTDKPGQKVIESSNGTIPAPESTKSTDAESPDHQQTTEEVNGRKGPDPTRYGDWEKNGRCIDF